MKQLVMLEIWHRPTKEQPSGPQICCPRHWQPYELVTEGQHSFLAGLHTLHVVWGLCSRFVVGMSGTGGSQSIAGPSCSSWVVFSAEEILVSVDFSMYISVSTYTLHLCPGLLGTQQTSPSTDQGSSNPKTVSMVQYPPLVGNKKPRHTQRPA